MEAGIRIGLLLLLALWCFEIVRPFIVPVIWGIIIAVAVYPAYAWLVSVLGGHKGLAALSVTILMLVILVGPTIMLADTMVAGVRELALQIRAGNLYVPAPPESVETWPIIGGPLFRFWTLAVDNLGEALSTLAPQIRGIGGWLLSTAGGVGFGILQFVFAIIVSGVLLTHSQGGEKTVMAIANRLIGENGEKFADLAGATVRSVSTGIVGIALIQAIMAGLGFLAVGLPAAGLLASLCLILAVIQLGCGLVLIPAAIYLFATTDTYVAVLFLCWSVVIMILDNVLKPILLGRGAKVPMAVIFVGAIGGFVAYGIIGLFVGAVVLALSYTLVDAWVHERYTPGTQS
jgi:predicted PurR-regulated permease PerM